MRYEVELAVTRAYRVTVNADDDEQAVEKAQWHVVHNFEDFFDQAVEVVDVDHLDADDES